jgi:CBS domain-containing protein
VKTHQILQSKGASVQTVSAESSLADVVHQLVENNIGSLLVMDGDRLAGIITERDILRACANDSRPLEEITVAERMTTKIVTASPSEDVNSVMGILTANRIRHLPIVEDSRLVGIISIGDVVKAQYDQLSMENHFLKHYIHSSAPV